MADISFIDVSEWLSPWSAHLAAFGLMLCRVAGLLAVGPLLGRAILPWQARVGLALSLAMLMAPLINPSAVPTFDIMSGARAAMSEFGLGFLLGCSSLLMLWAVPLAGHLLDQQTGQASSDDAAEPEGSPQTRWLALWTTACFLLCTPVNGHLQLVAVLCDSLRSWPLGQWSGSLFDPSTAALLLQHASELSLTVAAPALAILVLVNLTLGILGSAGSPGPSAIFGGTLRPAVSLIVLASSLSGINQSVAEALRWDFADEVHASAPN